MANSYIEYNQNLSETTYDVPFKVLSIDDVNVKGYDGSAWSDLTVSERDAVEKTVTLDTAPSAFDKIRVWRNTGTSQLVDFQNGSRLSESDLDTAYQQGLFVAQEVSENASTEIAGIGPQGPQGIQGVAGNDGADGADGADGVSATVALSESFESSEQSFIDGASTVSLAHGLSVVPKILQVVLRCKTSEQNYSVGDELDVSSMIITRDTTNVACIMDGSFVLANKTTFAAFNPTPANWKLVFRAFA